MTRLSILFLPLLLSASAQASPSLASADTSHLPGGEGTYVGPLNKKAFSHPSAQLDLDQGLDFHVGRSLFKRFWVSSPSSTKAADGLGPLYNARSCLECHPRNGRGRAPNGPDNTSVSLFVRLSIPAQTKAQAEALSTRKLKLIPEPTYGQQFHPRAVPGLEGEGTLRIEYSTHEETLTDGTVISMRKPQAELSNLKYGPLHAQTRTSLRLAPPMIGLGLLEAIPEQDLINLSDPDDRNGDGISGRLNRVWSPTHQAVGYGRFGWKAGNVTLADQVHDALAGDIGISNPLFPAPWGDCTDQQSDCRNAPHGDDERYGHLEASPKVMTPLVFYSRHLAVPHRPDAYQEDVLAGEAIFHQLGCAQCHQPSFVTSDTAADPTHRKQHIWPYTDLLLHDMGEGLADHRPEGEATGREWRTPPLWGLGHNAAVNGHVNYLHDGRAQTLAEAILWHGGEAQAAQQAYRQLSAEQRLSLETFLLSL